MIPLNLPDGAPGLQGRQAPSGRRIRAGWQGGGAALPVPAVATRVISDQLVGRTAIPGQCYHRDRFGNRFVAACG